MYYGYDLMWTLTFVPVGFVIVMAASVAYCLVYVVGAARGGQAAFRYVQACTTLLVAASVGDVVYALASGDGARFLQWYGIWPLLEMALLGVMCVGSLWFMATAYVRGRLREQASPHVNPGKQAMPAGEPDGHGVHATEESPSDA